MNITKITVSELSQEEKNKIYDMYINTYTYGKQDIWFNTQKKLFKKYPCLITVNNQYDKFYIMYQLMNNYNKISLIAHNLLNDSITELFSMLCHLLNNGGYIMEASGAISWKLRKLKTNYFNTKESIETALDINPNKKNSNKITINPDFLYATNTYSNNAEIKIQKQNMKLNYYYSRTYINSKTGKIYTKYETLFGNPDSICSFEGKLDCSRDCKPLVNNNLTPKQKGNRFGTKLKKTHKNNSRKNIKKKKSKNLKKYKNFLKNKK